jgi:UDP-N-acetylglucosamine--N-acetylmuramyl-(pentapeptide) pyrophosphoryl-undecaprenol N-acetylglucosamine transferase
MKIDNVILIVGGGTGGHISPGIALYEEANKRNIAVKFLANRRDRRFKYLSSIESEDMLFYTAPRLTKNPLKVPLFLIQFIWALIHIRYIVNKYGITDIIGMGGYVSAPSILSFMRSKKVHIWLCEQNTVPGMVTTFFQKYAQMIFTTFDDTEDYLKDETREKIACVGNPVRKQALPEIPKNEARKYFNMEKCDRVILAIGGSQGARQISELVLNLKLKFQKEFKHIGIIWSTGAVNYEHYKKIIRSDDKFGFVYLSPFIENVGMAYNAADIAISRSGSGVMMELAAMKLPSILIPYPYAAKDHQNKNADVFDRSGGSIKVTGENVTAEKIGPILFEILGSETKLRQMQRKCAQEARVHAAQDIIDRVIGSK